jgi:hypothetical protein
MNAAQWTFLIIIVALIVIELGLSFYFDKKDNQ